MLLRALAAATLAASGGGCGQPAPSETVELGPTIVVDVIDGDTIEVDFGSTTEVVRLLGIDTPEKTGGTRPPECFGDEASAFTDKLIPVGTEVSLHLDIEARDQYGRLLAFVHRSSDDLFVNLTLVEHGYATAYVVAPNLAFSESFEHAGDVARKEQRGFWAACGGSDIALP